MRTTVLVVGWRALWYQNINTSRFQQHEIPVNIRSATGRIVDLRAPGALQHAASYISDQNNICDAKPLFLCPSTTLPPPRSSSSPVHTLIPLSKQIRGTTSPPPPSRAKFLLLAEKFSHLEPLPSWPEQVSDLPCQAILRVLSTRAQVYIRWYK